MSDELTNDELDRLQALCEAATPGPWVVATPTRAGFTVRLNQVPGLGFDESGLCVWENLLSSDHDFIAESRTALPRLISAHREALAEIAAWRTGFAIGTVSLKAESRLPTSDGPFHVVSTTDGANP